MPKTVIALYSQEQFDIAMEHVLSKTVCEHVPNRPQRANHAINKIFLESLERKPEYRESCEIIRHVTNLMGIEGIYKFAETGRQRTDRQKLHLALAYGLSMYDIDSVGLMDRVEFQEKNWIDEAGFVTRKGSRYVTTGKA